MKKVVFFICSFFCLMLVCILNIDFNNSDSLKNLTIVSLNVKAFADDEGGPHNFCETDPGDTCVTYGATINDCDETSNPFKGC